MAKKSAKADQKKTRPDWVVNGKEDDDKGIHITQADGMEKLAHGPLKCEEKRMANAIWRSEKNIAQVVLIGKIPYSSPVNWFT